MIRESASGFRVRFLSLAAIAVLAACKRDAASDHATPSPSDASIEASSPSLGSGEGKELPFIENDYERALALAKETKRSIVVDTFASWCHSCLSMRSFVFEDPKVIAHANDVVWLVLDVDKKENEAILKRLLPPALPTFYRLDSNGEVTSKWIGTMSVDEFTRFVTTARPDKSISAKMVELLEEKKYTACQEAVLEVLAKKPAASADMLGVAINGIECAKAERDASAETGKSSTKPPAAFSPAKKESFLRMTNWLAALVDDFSYDALADDRSGAFETLVDALRELKDEPRRRSFAEHWVRFLEGQVTLATTKEARVVFDSHRLLAYAETGDPTRSIPMLEESAKDFPNDYNPPARLARTYFTLQRYPEARTAIGRALSLAYGPRKLRLFELAADIESKSNDRASEKAALDSALELAKTLSLTEGYQKLVRGLEERRKKLG